MKINFIYSKWLPNNELQKFKAYLEDTRHKILLRKIPDNPKDINISEAQEIFNYNMSLIQKADIVLIECSYVSSEIGYSISRALELKKPVIALYNMSDNLKDERHIHNIQVGLLGNGNKYFLLRKYTSENLKKTLNISLTEARDLKNVKFNLILTSDIDAYLNTQAKLKKMSKADIVRDAISKYIELDGHLNSVRDV